MAVSDALEARRPRTYASFFPELAGQASRHPFAELNLGIRSRATALAIAEWKGCSTRRHPVAAMTFSARTDGDRGCVYR
jgi:hypothetical protein